MKAELIKIVKQLAIITLVISSLIILGNTLDSVLPWEQLTIFFSLLRRLVLLVDFIIDTNTLFLLIGIGLTIQVAIWLFRAVLYLTSFFNK